MPKTMMMIMMMIMTRKPVRDSLREMCLDVICENLASRDGIQALMLPKTLQQDLCELMDNKNKF